MNIQKFYKINIINMILIIILSGCSHSNKKINSEIKLQLLKSQNKFHPKIAWSHSVGDGSNLYYSTLHPAIKNHKIFVADRHGLIMALDIKTGKEIWTVDLSTHNKHWKSLQNSALLSSGITVSDSYIYIGSERAKVYAIDEENGSINWSKNVTGEVLSSPVLNNNAVLINTSNGVLQSLNKFDGKILWTVNIGTSKISLRRKPDVIVSSGLIIAGDDIGRINVFSIDYGQLIWRQEISFLNKKNKIENFNNIQAFASVDNIIYISSYNDNLVALDLKSRQIIWNREISSASDFIIKNNNIYLVDKNNNILVLNRKDGKTIWIQNSLSKRTLTAPELFDKDYLIVGDSKGYLNWFNVHNGNFEDQMKVDDSGFLNKPIVFNNKIFIQSKNGKVYSIIH